MNCKPWLIAAAFIVTWRCHFARPGYPLETYDGEEEFETRGEAKAFIARAPVGPFECLASQTDGEHGTCRVDRFRVKKTVPKKDVPR